MIVPDLALIEESVVKLGLARWPWVGHAKGNKLTDVSVLVSLQLRPETSDIQINFDLIFSAASVLI